MSLELYELFRNMNIGTVESQLVLQCAPLFAGLKESNLFIIQKDLLESAISMIDNTKLSYHVLLKEEKRVTLLIYDKVRLIAYLKRSDVNMMLHTLGYENTELDHILPELELRYMNYMATGRSFPHEMGLLLGYPVEDVRGFIKNHGENALYTGYWRVYENVSDKKKLFHEYRCAEEICMWMLMMGKKISDIVNETDIAALVVKKGLQGGMVSNG